MKVKDDTIERPEGQFRVSPTLLLVGSSKQHGERRLLHLGQYVVPPGESDVMMGFFRKHAVLVFSEDQLARLIEWLQTLKAHSYTP